MKNLFLILGREQGQQISKKLSFQRKSSRSHHHLYPFLTCLFFLLFSSESWSRCRRDLESLSQLRDHSWSLLTQRKKRAEIHNEGDGLYLESFDQSLSGLQEGKLPPFPNSPLEREAFIDSYLYPLMVLRPELLFERPNKVKRRGKLLRKLFEKRQSVAQMNKRVDRIYQTLFKPLPPSFLRLLEDEEKIQAFALRTFIQEAITHGVKDHLEQRGLLKEESYIRKTLSFISLKRLFRLVLILNYDLSAFFKKSGYFSPEQTKSLMSMDPQSLMYEISLHRLELYSSEEKIIFARSLFMIALTSAITHSVWSSLEEKAYKEAEVKRKSQVRLEAQVDQTREHVEKIREDIAQMPRGVDEAKERAAMTYLSSYFEIYGEVISVESEHFSQVREKFNITRDSLLEQKWIEYAQELKR